MTFLVQLGIFLLVFVVPILVFSFGLAYFGIKGKWLSVRIIALSLWIFCVVGNAAFSALVGEPILNGFLQGLGIGALLAVGVIIGYLIFPWVWKLFNIPF